LISCGRSNEESDHIGLPAAPASCSRSRDAPTNHYASAEIPTITRSSNAENMSERGDIWLSRCFSLTCILSAFIGAATVGMLFGEPDVLMLFGAVGGVMVGAVFYFVVAGVIRLLF
jgi:hypothetical protein